MSLHGIPFARQVALPIVYKGTTLDAGYKLDIVIEDMLIVELKSVERLLPIHEAQLLTYLRLSGIGVGLLMNFNAAALKNGLRRLVL